MCNFLNSRSRQAVNYSVTLTVSTLSEISFRKSKHQPTKACMHLHHLHTYLAILEAEIGSGIWLLIQPASNPRKARACWRAHGGSREWRRWAGLGRRRGINVKPPCTAQCASPSAFGFPPFFFFAPPSWAIRRCNWLNSQHSENPTLENWASERAKPTSLSNSVTEQELMIFRERRGRSFSIFSIVLWVYY